MNQKKIKQPNNKVFKLDFAIIKEVKKNLPKGCGFGKSKPLPTAKGNEIGIVEGATKR